MSTDRWFREFERTEAMREERLDIIRARKREPLTAAQWNAAHRPGIAVIVKMDDGRLKHTHTRSEAWNLGHGQPVVMLEGISGGYDLSRVTPMEIQDTPLA